MMASVVVTGGMRCRSVACVPSSYTLLRPCQPYCILNAARHACDAAGCLHCIQPLLLLRPEPAGSGLHLDAGEHRHSLAHHVRRDRPRRPADQVSAALGEAKLHRAAIGVTQGAGVIPEQPGIAGAAGNADVLLDLLFRWQGLAAQPVPAA